MKACRITAVCLLAAMLLQACSMKKNTAATRNYTAFITRYNIYFNGNQHYIETLKDMEDKYEDDYSQMLYVHPAEAKGNERAPQPSGDFTRSIEKAQKAIQLRSIKKRPARKPGKGNDPEYKKWLKREEYNPFLHNAWMMMGRSQYMNGDFMGAASTFFYVSKHFRWLPATVTEASLWQAMSYCAIDWLFEAESILGRIKEKELTDGNLKGLYALAYADFYVRSRDYEKAVPMLTEAVRHAKGSQKNRLNFLLGQCLQNLGRKEEAYRAFKEAGGGGVSYRTKFNARIKQSEVFQGADITPEVKALKGMLKYGRNSDFLDQIYYAIGNLYLSKADTLKAMENYRMAVASSKRNAIDKALAQITLGGLYYEQGAYDKAQPCYSESMPLLPKTYPDYDMLRRRSDVLDELAVYSQNVTMQDSLLRLSRLSPEEQRKVVDRIIIELREKERKEAEEQRRQEYLANVSQQGTGLNAPTGSSAAPSTFTMNTDDSWYFYNPATVNAGRTEFQRRWGSRKLEDDWRRRNKSSYSSFDEPESDAGEAEPAENSDSVKPLDRETEAHQNDPHYPEYYLKQIPQTDAERATASEVIQEGLYNMGVILKDKMRDYPAAERSFNRLLTEYPDNVYRLDTYHNLYLMYLLDKQPDMAERYRKLIVSDFPESKYGEALRDPDYARKLMNMDSIQAAMYDKAYAAYLADNNTAVHKIAADMKREYPLSRIMPKFMFLDALAYVTERNPEKFGATLQELIERYPDVDVSPLASDYLRQLNQGRKLNSSGGNLRGMVWSTRLTADSAAVSVSDAPAEFDLSDAPSPRLFVLLYPTGEVDGRQLLFDVARFNFNSFTVRDFDIEQMTFGPVSLIAVSGFENLNETDRYRRMMENSDIVKLPDNVIPVVISRHNFDILLTQGRSFEEYFDAVGDDRLRRTHTEVLPAEEYPSAEEMYAPADDVTDEELGEEIQEVTDEEIKEEVTAEPEKTIEPEKPVTPAPTPKPETKPDKKPDTKPVPKPAPKPKPEPKPVPVPEKPKEPEPVIPDGSEGDDPLLD